jgi:alcohol dehydrogenase (cytochrome c)
MQLWGVRIGGRRVRLVLLLTVVLVVCGTVVAVHGLRSRARIAVLKVSGRLPDVDWPDLLRMMSLDSPYHLDRLIATGNPYTSIENPYTRDADTAAGASSFRMHCAQCHAGGKGGAPDLEHDGLEHASDWALYQTITRGVPGTAMPPHAYTDRERWQLVAYIRERRRADADGDASPASVRRVSADEIAAGRSRPNEWLTYSGTYDAHRASALSQVDTKTIARLHPVWMFQLPSAAVNESTPIVVADTMYITSGVGDVWALDAGTGEVRWHFVRALPTRLAICCAKTNRGVAVLGDLVYIGTLDAHLIALNAATGRVAWDVEVASAEAGYTITGAPLAVPEGIVTGVAGGEFGVSGFIDAYDPMTGERRWRFRTIPRPGESGHDTWGGESWKTGGAPTWLTGSYDAATHMLYWGVGNPAPSYAGREHEGDNLYSNSVVAIDARTGRLAWYFQFTPHDEHDWDAVQIPILADAVVDGRERHLLLWANRNAFYYVLDRDTGTFLRAVAFEHQTWTAGIDASGRPRTLPDVSPTETGRFVYPTAMGATNWWSPAFDASRSLVFVPTLHLGGTYYRDRSATEQHEGQPFLGGAVTPAFDRPFWNAVKAIDAVTGTERWEHRFDATPNNVLMGGLAVTAGGLVFAGHGRQFVALDAETGHQLWSFDVGAVIVAAPAVYASDQQQRIALVAGHSLIVFGLESSDGQ